MTNALTGDHDVVVQVSVGTLNRVLASLHQNAMVDPPVLPTIPHSAYVRVGDDPATRVDGVQGVARVQSGVPQLDLIHRSQDRVRMRVPLRAWFTPSSGSARFPEFTYGTLRAEFGLQELAAVGTPGIHLGPAFYVPPRYHFDVDPSTVSFTSFGDTSQDAAIARQAVVLLQTAFATARGQPMLDQLMQRKLITLVGPDGSQVVAIGVELGPGDPAIQQPRNISKVLTAGQDLAIAASSEFALSLLQPHLDALRQHHPIVHVDLLFTSVDYTIDFSPGPARWAVDTTVLAGATVPCGALDLTIDGRARTTSALPDCTFTIRDRLLVIFNPSNQLLFLARKGSPNVQAHVAGIGLAESVVEAKIAQQYNTQIDHAIQVAFPNMAATAFIKEVITEQLKLSDDQASTRLESAEFSVDGVVLRGKVPLSPRLRGSVQFGALNDLSGYGALLSWFPGGRITAFGWKWMPPPPAPTGTVLERIVTDRFVFQPPEGMPGLPPPSGGETVGGRVCLYIQGLVIDPTTGAEVAAFAQDCYSVPDPPPLIVFPIFPSADAANRVTAPLWARIGTDTEVGIIDAARGKEEMPLANTLIWLLGPGAAPASLAIAEGIDRAGRDDAGLLVLVAVPEGALDDGAATVLRESGPEREAPIRVVEDVDGSWARAFAAALDSGPSFRLVGVDGRLVWSHDGALDAETLAQALRENLQPSGAPGLVPQRPGPPIGRRLARPESLIADDNTVIAGADRPITICFALDWAESSRAQIYRLNERAASNEGLIVVILTDTGAAQAAEFGQANAPQLIVVPDPDRTITAGYDVWLWPTTLSVAADGTVTSITTGYHPFDDEVPAMSETPEQMTDF